MADQLRGVYGLARRRYYVRLYRSGIEETRKLVTCRAWFGASLSSRRMFSLFVELILKLSFAVSPLSALELMYRCNLYRQ